MGVEARLVAAEVVARVTTGIVCGSAAGRSEQSQHTVVRVRRGRKAPQ
jgi:uncharacterized protein with FMN-binding domain